MINYFLFTIFFLIAMIYMEWHEKSAKSMWKKGNIFTKDLEYLNSKTSWSRKYELVNGLLQPQKRPKWWYLWIFEPKYQEFKYGSSTWRAHLYTAEKKYQMNFWLFLSIAISFISLYNGILLFVLVYTFGALKEAFKKFNLFTE